MQRGDIYIANLNPRSGSEQKGIRPVVIISHNGFNTTPNWNSIIIVPFSTSEKQLKRTPTTVFITKNDSGLDEDSVILCHQITTIDKSKLQIKKGSLSEKQLLEVEQAIRNALAMFS